MNRYQIFLASSINEFMEYRNEIGDFIRKIQDVLIDYDIKIKLFECEFHDNSIGIGRKQEEYNEEIKKSQVFLMLIGKRLGQYTLEEYNVAKECKILQKYILLENIEHDQSVENFKQIVDETSNVYSFNDIVEIKFYIAKIIENLCKFEVNVKVTENEIYINNISIKF